MLTEEERETIAELVEEGVRLEMEWKKLHVVNGKSMSEEELVEMSKSDDQLLDSISVSRYSAHLCSRRIWKNSLVIPAARRAKNFVRI